jgi:hypothetical protein
MAEVNFMLAFFDGWGCCRLIVGLTVNRYYDNKNNNNNNKKNPIDEVEVFVLIPTIP